MLYSPFHHFSFETISPSCPPGSIMSTILLSQSSRSDSSIDKPVPALEHQMSLAASHAEPASTDKDVAAAAAVSSAKETPASQLRWPRIRSLWQDAISEFFGTMILIIFGDGVVAQVVLSRRTMGDYQSISWGWG